MRPEDIETLSFKIIDLEAGEHGFPSDEWSIIRRIVHTSADFEYIKTIRIHPSAIRSGTYAVRSGKPVITDTEMAMAGIRKDKLGLYGSSVKCFINNPDVIKKAGESGTTRAHAAVDMAAPLMDGGIFVIGNAPTALLRLIELVRENKARPALVVGLPVGFVKAAESKEALIGMDIPYISDTGRKGGSNVAASVINALVILAIIDDKLATSHRQG